MAIDVKAWYERYGPMVIRRCRALLRNEDEAMDAAQDVFVNLLKSAGKLHSSFPSSLLYTMATNVCLNRLRAKKRETREALSHTESGIPDDFTGDRGKLFSITDWGFDQVDAELLVDSILEDESGESRAICFMYYADGMSLAGIAETVGLSISGVRKRLESFRKRARLKLGEDLE